MSISDVKIVKKILNYIEKINSLKNSIEKKETILKEEYMIYDLYSFYLAQIGEEAKKLTEEFISVNNQIERKSIKGLRDKIVHHYGYIDTFKINEIIKKDIPKLKKFCKKILNKIN